jgi:ALG3 protein
MYRTIVTSLQVIASILVINAFRYTEIDWTAYMQQVEIFLNGDMNYGNLIGGTVSPTNIRDL